MLEGVAEVRGRSLWQDARRRLLRNKAAVVSMIVLAVIAGLALLAPWLSPHPYDEIYWERILAPPDFANAHWFGTDGNGRDLFVRTLYGARVSLTVGILATAVSLVIGVTWGAIAGYFGGRIDNLMMRFVDIMYSLPFMFFVILLDGRVRPPHLPDLHRDRRGRVADHGAHRARPDARGESARSSSRRRARRACATATIITRHIIPNVLGPVIVYVTLTVPQVILIESFLSFLGLGVQEPLTSWGVLIAEGAAQMEIRALAADLPRDLPRGHPVLLQLHRRRPARRARPEGPVKSRRFADQTKRRTSQKPTLPHHALRLFSSQHCSIFQAYQRCLVPGAVR